MNHMMQYFGTSERLQIDNFFYAILKQSRLGQFSIYME